MAEPRLQSAVRAPPSATRWRPRGRRLRARGRPYPRSLGGLQDQPRGGHFLPGPRTAPPPGATCRSAAPLPPSPSSVARRRGAWPVQVCGDRPLSPVRAGSQFRGGVGAQSGRTLFSRPRRARESGRGASALRSLLSLDEHPFSRARSLSLFSSFASSPAHLNSPRVLTYKRTALREEGVEPDVGSRVGERVAAHVSPERARPVTRGPLRLDSGMPLSSYLCTWRY